MKIAALVVLLAAARTCAAACDVNAGHEACQDASDSAALLQGPLHLHGTSSMPSMGNSDLIERVQDIDGSSPTELQKAWQGADKNDLLLETYTLPASAPGQQFMVKRIAQVHGEENCAYSPPPTPTCILRSDDGCPSQCSTSSTYGYLGASPDDIFTGGEFCQSGENICTCNVFGTNLLKKISLASGADADPKLCAEKCQEDVACKAAFFRRHTGECFLLNNCNSKVSTWVGKWAFQGGVTYVKPARPMLVDPGENVWPISFFGSYEKTPWSAVVNPAWIGDAGVRTGWDWTLPAGLLNKTGHCEHGTGYCPAARGLLTLERTFSDPATDASKIEKLPVPSFAVNPVIDMWLSWRDFEADEGTYVFDQLLRNIDAADSRGWKVGIRMLTSETRTAPLYMGPSARNGSRGYNLKSKQKAGSRMINYDPADSIFHARYLAFVDAIAKKRLCHHRAVKLVYVGYASDSNGDEGIGPHSEGDGPPENYPHVMERLQAWQAACDGKEWKVIMGGFSTHGLSLGFGTRNGFVEHYWYRIPDAEIGQTVTSDGYLEVSESAPVFRPKMVALGDENEEYEENWASEYRTSYPGDYGGPENVSAEEQGGIARFGPLASFQYRYLISSLRTLQMRVSTYLVNDFALNPSLGAFMALELGRTAADSPDAWCFLIEAELYQIGTVKNFERWLYQRDTAETSSVAEARITQTPANPSTRTWMTKDKHDWIARSAEGGVMNFQLDRHFMAARASPTKYTIKVTFFDVVDRGLIQVTTPTGGTLGTPQPTTGDGSIKTATFEVVGNALSPESSAFQVRGFDPSGENPMEIVISFVRVVRID